MDIIEQYLKRSGMLIDYSASNNIKYSEVVICRQDPPWISFLLQKLTLDLSTIVSCLSGPKRPHDRVPAKDIHKEFRDGLTQKVSFKSFGLDASAANKEVTI